MEKRSGNESTLCFGSWALLVLATTVVAGGCGEVAESYDSGDGETFDAAPPADALAPDAAPELFTLSVSTDGDGEVTSSPAGIACGAECSGDFESGTDVTLTATPSGGAVFSGWSGACSGAGSCVVTMDGDKSVTATFGPASYPLTVTRAGGGSGTVVSSPGGIDCGVDCTETYLEGEMVTLTATADTDSSFTGWSGAGCVGVDPCVVTMTAAADVTATFEILQYDLTVSKNGTGGGTVTSDVAGIDCGVDCVGVYDYGTVVTLTATADGNSTFTGWSGGGCGAGATCVVTMTAATAVTATFTINQYPLDVVKDGTGTGTVVSSPGGIDCGIDCSEPYDYGTNVTLTATPDPSSSFTGWSLPGCGGGPTCIVPITAATTVTATFTLKQYDLTVVVEGLVTGSVVSSPTGIDCGADCTEPYDYGTSVTLTASTPCGRFLGWSGGGCGGTGSCVVPMTSSAVVTASFEPITYYVNAVTGLDTNDGTAGAPFKTITHALSLTAPECSVWVAPGTYDVANGETFPLSLPPGVSLIGDEPNKGAGPNPTVIMGGSTTGFIGTAIDAGVGSVIAGFTILADPTAGATYNMNLAISSSRVEIANNHLINGNTGIYVWMGASDLVIVGNVITGNTSLGLGFIGGGVGSRVEANQITANSVGVEYDSDGGDLGGGATGSIGGNVISCNTRNDIWTNTAVTIDAKDNFWDHTPPTITETMSGGFDIRRPLSATVITTGAMLASVPCP